ncbi:hypothetical protein [uncultured Bradyrhizobium sp.]|jgi:hypothetical protein|uniref:hypothetical protein n=1 Tax=uncultured Bradyrhizobium sp. TaxID=199684 RepID=UPI002609ABFC|nr:hypothetical protein [uncultured Bradyrhizobium sp.]
MMRNRSAPDANETLMRDRLPSHRRPLSVAELPGEDIALIERAEVMTDKSYSLGDIPNVENEVSMHVLATRSQALAIATALGLIATPTAE